MVMEEWDFVDDRDLQNWKGGVVCMTCQHFTYGVDQHCHTMVGCTSGRSNCNRAAFKEALQVVGTDITEGDALGT